MLRDISLEEAVSTFRKVCDNAYEEQDRLLCRLMDRNAHTEYGERYGFGNIHNEEQYAKAVPLSEFSDYDSAIGRIVVGERNILTADPPAFFNISAGSTGESKYIPLVREDIARQHLYEDLAVSGIIREALPQYSEKELFGCIFNMSDFFLTDMPDGIMNGVRSGAYFRTARKEGIFEPGCFSAPEEVLFPEKLTDMLYVKLRFALANPDITAIHGVFVHRAVGLFRYIEDYWDELLDDMEHGTVNARFDISDAWRNYLHEHLPPDPERASELRALDRTSLRMGMLRKIWKKLRYARIISGDMFSVFSKKLADYLGDLPLHSFAYASSESNIGIAPRMNVTDEYVLLPDTCYFEFIPEDQIQKPQDFLTIRQVEKGKRYELVLTTLSGLYRYRIGDVVEITGFLGEAPAVRICYRRDLVISILDERVNAMQLRNAVRRFSEENGITLDYYCVGGNYDERVPKYTFFVETNSSLFRGAPEALDRCLCEQSFNYRSERQVNDLGCLEICRVRNGTFHDYEKMCHRQGKRTEQAKLLRILNGKDQIKYFADATEERL